MLFGPFTKPPLSLKQKKEKEKEKAIVKEVKELSIVFQMNDTLQPNEEKNAITNQLKNQSNLQLVFNKQQRAPIDGRRVYPQLQIAIAKMACFSLSTEGSLYILTHLKYFDAIYTTYIEVTQNSLASIAQGILVYQTPSLQSQRQENQNTRTKITALSVVQTQLINTQENNDEMMKGVESTFEYELLKLRRKVLTRLRANLSVVLSRLYKWAQQRLSNITQINEKYRFSQLQLIEKTDDLTEKYRLSQLQLNEKTDKLMQKLNKVDQSSKKAIELVFDNNKKRLDTLNQQLKLHSQTQNNSFESLNDRILLMQQSMKETTKLMQTIDKVMKQQLSDKIQAYQSRLTVEMNRFNEQSIIASKKIRQQLRQQQNKVDIAIKNTAINTERGKRHDFKIGLMQDRNTQFIAKLDDFTSNLENLTKNVFTKAQIRSLLRPMQATIQQAITGKQQFGPAIQAINQSINNISEAMDTKMNERMNVKLRGFGKDMRKRDKQVYTQLRNIMHKRFFQLRKSYDQSLLKISQDIANNKQKIEKMQLGNRLEVIMSNPSTRYAFIKERAMRAIR